MATIVTRAAKGSSLTNTEVDNNFTNLNTEVGAALPKAGGAMTGAITTNSTFDGRDVAADGVTADAALPKAGGTVTGNVVFNSAPTFNTAITMGSSLNVASTIGISGNTVIDASRNIIATSLDISGNIDVDGVTNLDVVDIDGAVNMATTALVTGVLTTTAATVFNGGFTSNGSGTMSGSEILYFRDAQIYIRSTADGQLDIVADTEIQIAATTVDLNGSLDVSGTLGVAGVVTANAGVVVDNFTLDGTTLALSSGSMTLDVAGDVVIDADGGSIFFNDAGTTIGSFVNNSTDFEIRSNVNNKDMLFRGTNGGSPITALTLNMSEAGEATFNSDILLGDGKVARFGADQDFRISFNGTNAVLQNVTSDSDITFLGKDGSSPITMLTLDAGAAGKATFNAGIVVGADLTVGNSYISNNYAQFANMRVNNNAYIGSENTPTAIQIQTGGAVAFSSTIAATSATFTPSSGETVVLTRDSAGPYFGVSSNHSLRLITNNSTRVTISNTGTVTLGSPNLDLKADNARLLIEEADGTDIVYLGDHTGGGHGSLFLYNHGGAPTVKLTADSHANYINNGNNFGIGTSAPASLLDVGGGLIADPIVRIDSAAGGDPSLVFDTGAANRSATIKFHDQGNTAAGFIDYLHNGDKMNFGAGSATGVTMTVNDGKVGVNTSSPAGKLHVNGLTGSAATILEGSGNGDTVPLHFRVKANNGNVTNHGIFGNAGTAGSDNSIQIGPSSTSGITVEANGSVVLNESGGDVDFRVESDNNANAFFVEGSSGVVNFGRGSSSIDTNGGYIEYGVAIMSIGSSSQTYFVRNTSNSAYSFYVTGAGQIHAVQTSISSLSDERLKENIVDIDTGLAEVMALKPRKFDWKEGEGSNEKNVTGFVAQEVETVLPNLIGNFKHDDLDDAKSVKMGDMVPTLVKAIQEQQTLIETLTARIAALEE